MCGRYRRTTSQEELARRYGIAGVLSVLMNEETRRTVTTPWSGPTREAANRSNSMAAHLRLSNWPSRVASKTRTP
jgi:hypothetical protein